MSDGLGKNVPLDKTERAVLVRLINAGWKGKFVDSPVVADAMKSIMRKVEFSAEEIAGLQPPPQVALKAQKPGEPKKK